MTDLMLSAEERLAKQTRDAIKAWEDAGAPLARGYGEQTRDNIRGWPANGAYTREVLRLATHLVEQKTIADQNAAAIEALRLKRQSQAKVREVMTAEMREIRENVLGITQAEMDAELDVKPNTIKNAERPTSSYSLARVEQLLRRYRAKAKMAERRLIQS